MAAKFMEDMHLLASEMYAISRKLNLAMQVRFPRECDDPILTSNQLKEYSTTMGSNPKDKTNNQSTEEFDENSESTNPTRFYSLNNPEELFDFDGDLIEQGY